VVSQVSSWFAPLGPAETTFLGLTTAVAVLVVATIAISTYAIVLRIGNRRRELLWVDLRSRWDGPVLAAVVDQDRVQDVYDAVPSEYRRFFVRFVMDFSQRVRGEERRVLHELVQPYLGDIAGLLDHRRPEVRTRAVQTLGTVGLPRFAEELVAALDDPSTLTAMVAARHLAREEFAQYAPEIIRRLHRFEGWNRRFLASMLAAVGPEAAGALRDGLANRERPAWARSVFAEALRMLRDPASGDVAVDVLEHSDDPELITRVVRLLAEVGRPTHLHAALRHASSSDPIVRAQSLRAVGHLGDETVVDVLLEAMDDASPWASLHAARGVRDAGGASKLKELSAGEGRVADLARRVLLERVAT
jgi:HEAT repeat protein